MELFSAESFILTIGLVGAVIVIAALLSGLIERSGLPQVAVFLALGAILGPAALGLLDISLDSAILAGFIHRCGWVRHSGSKAP